MEFYKKLKSIIKLEYNNKKYTDSNGYILDSIIEKLNLNINELEKILINNSDLFYFKPIYINRKKNYKIKFKNPTNIIKTKMYIDFEYLEECKYFNGTKYCEYYKYDIFIWISDYSRYFYKINEPIKRLNGDIYIHPELMIYLTSTISIDDCILYMDIIKEMNIIKINDNKLINNKRKCPDTDKHTIESEYIIIDNIGYTTTQINDTTNLIDLFETVTIR